MTNIRVVTVETLCNLVVVVIYFSLVLIKIRYLALLDVTQQLCVAAISESIENVPYRDLVFLFYHNHFHPSTDLFVPFS